MNLASTTPSGPWLVLGWTMLHFLWAGALVGLCAAGARRLVHAASPEVRYVFALACLAALVAAPCIIATDLLAQPHLADPGVDLRPAVSSAGAETPPAASPEKVAVAPIVGGPLAPTPATPPPAAAIAPAPAVAPQLPDLSTVVAYLPWLWLLGTPLTFVLLAAGLVGADRLRRQSVVLDHGPVNDLCRHLMEVLRIAGPVAVAVNEHIAAPLLVGIVRPLILLPPAALTGWAPAQLEMVLLHELAHVRRWDNLVNLGQRIVEALLFFHPVVWWVSHWVRLERECCCDALVVAHTGRPHAYAHFLAGFTCRPPVRAVVVGMAEHHLVTRIRRLVSRKDHPMKLSRNVVGPVGLLLLAPFFLLAVHAQPASKAGEAPPAKPDPAAHARMAALLKDALADLEPDTAEVTRGLKNRTVSDIAIVQGRLGDRDGARKTLQRARALVEAMPEENRYWELRMLAQAYARAGDTDTVLELVKTIPDEVPNYRGKAKEFRAMVLQESARELARAGAGEDALKVADQIEVKETKTWVHAQVLEQLALVQAKAGKFADALLTIDKMDEPVSQVTGLAGNIYFNYTYPDYPHEPGLALLQAEAGDKEGAKKTLRQAAALAKSVPADRGKDRALAALACAQARLGDIAAAHTTAADLKNPIAANLAAATIAKALAQSGRSKEALQTIEQLPDKASKLHALYHCAVGQAQAGDKQGAAESFRQAVALLDSLGEEDRNVHSHNLACAQALAGDFEGALKTASTYRSDATVALASIAYEQAKAGDVKGALAIADRLPDNDWWKGNMLRSIALVQAERGDDEAALAWVRKLTVPNNRGNALLGIAEGLQKRKK